MLKPLLPPPRAEYDDDETELWQSDCRKVADRQGRREAVQFVLTTAAIIILTSGTMFLLIYVAKRFLP